MEKLDAHRHHQGGMKPNSYVSDGSSVRLVTVSFLVQPLTQTCSSPENLRRSVENINAKIGGIKKMDLFECARVPENVPLEDLIKTLSELKSEGHFSYIGMSECSAATLRRAHAVRGPAFLGDTAYGYPGPC